MKIKQVLVSLFESYLKKNVFAFKIIFIRTILAFFHLAPCRWVEWLIERLSFYYLTNYGIVLMVVISRFIAVLLMDGAKLKECHNFFESNSIQRFFSRVLLYRESPWLEIGYVIRAVARNIYQGGLNQIKGDKIKYFAPFCTNLKIVQFCSNVGDNCPPCPL